jgi:hypothetical protein
MKAQTGQGDFSAKSHMSGNPTSMIGLCQEDKSSPDATEERGCISFLIPRRVCWPLSRGSFFQIRTRLPFAVSAFQEGWVYRQDTIESGTPTRILFQKLTTHRRLVCHETQAHHRLTTFQPPRILTQGCYGSIIRTGSGGPGVTKVPRRSSDLAKPSPG